MRVRVDGFEVDSEERIGDGALREKVIDDGRDSIGVLDCASRKVCGTNTVGSVGEVSQKEGRRLTL